MRIQLPRNIPSVRSMSRRIAVAAVIMTLGGVGVGPAPGADVEAPPRAATTGTGPSPVPAEYGRSGNGGCAGSDRVQDPATAALPCNYTQPGTTPMKIDWEAVRNPLVLGNETIACRDPCVVLHAGRFRIFHSLVRFEPGHDSPLWYLGVTESADLVHWTEPRPLTPGDPRLNYGSPGSVVRRDGDWILCLQTYPTPADEVHAGGDARIWTLRSADLEHWTDPEPILARGPDVSLADHGRMIDAFLLRDRVLPDRWWCLYKHWQTGMSLSSSPDLRSWTPAGRVDAGENFCAVVDGDQYIVIHSPGDGIAFRRGPDLLRTEDLGVLTLDRTAWPWARGRLTAGFLFDGRPVPGIERWLLFFHGSSVEGKRRWRSHGAASLGVAWSHDLRHWYANAPGDPFIPNNGS